MNMTMRITIDVHYDTQRPIKEVGQHLFNMIPATMQRLEDEGLLSGELEDTSGFVGDISIDATHVSEPA